MSTPYAPQWAPLPPPPPTRQSADLALLLGLLSLPFTFLTGIPAIVFGIKALRVAGQAGGRGRAWTGIVLGTVMSLLALTVTAVVVARLVDGARDLAAPAGSERAQQRDARRAAADDAALVRVTGVALERLTSTPGVTLEHDAGATVDCIDSCSEVTVVVRGAAAQSGPLAREALLERLRSRGYLAFDGSVGCPPLQPVRPCSLRAPDGRESVSLTSEEPAPAYRLVVDGNR